MSAELFPYYNAELDALRRLAVEFADQYPQVASRLSLEGGVSVDPHVERLLEGSAFLAGRVRHKLDDEFPELTDALLGVLYPHYLAPVPSVLTAEFVADPARTPLLDGFTVPAQTPLLTPRANGVECEYRTVYPVTLWPLRVASARLSNSPQGVRLPPGTEKPRSAEGVLHIQLVAEAGATFAKLALDRLRFHIAGDEQAAAELYELVHGQADQVWLACPDRLDAGVVKLAPNQCLSTVGFERDEGLLPYPPHSSPGYRLLTEMFAYPAKFWYVDVSGFREAASRGFGQRLDLYVFLRQVPPTLGQAVTEATFRLACAPCVNLFPKTAEPIDLSQARYEYKVIPEVGQPTGYEVHTVESVTGEDPDGGGRVEFRPFYSVTHPTGTDGRGAYYYPVRRAAVVPRDVAGTETKGRDAGTDVYLSVVDRGWDVHLPATSRLVVRCLCTNRDRPELLRKAGEKLALRPQTPMPTDAIRCVRTPTLPLRPPRRRRGAFWRLVSHLSLNHLSLTGDEEGRRALQEILRLYDATDTDSGPAVARASSGLVDGLAGVSHRRAVERLTEGTAAAFVRGLEVTVELDEDKYLGTGAYLFAAVLDRFFGLYASLNSFTTLVAKAKAGGREIYRGRPRAGDKPLV